LADFRVERQKELDELFTQVLAALSKEGLITLEQVIQDGTKIKAQASTRSFQKRPGLIYHRYEAKAEDCQSCIRKPACCPDNEKRGRSVARPEESTIVIAFRKKMASEEAQAQYRRRGRVVDFCPAWIKSKLGLRQFHLRGLLKVQMEMLWACLTHNLQDWMRLRKVETATAI
jgi:DDE family transposase